MEAAKLKAGNSRRLSGVGGNGRRLSGWRAEDAENFLEENDDESERVEAARQKAEEEKRRAQQARSPFKETPGRKARTAVLTDMYSDAIQMCAENVSRRRLSACSASSCSSPPPALLLRKRLRAQGANRIVSRPALTAFARPCVCRKLTRRTLGPST